MNVTIRQQLFFWGIVLCFIFGSMWVLSDVFIPFVAGFIVAYLLDPMVDFFQRQFRLKRLSATCAAMGTSLLMMVLFFILFVPVLSNQVQLFIQNIPTYIQDVMGISERLLGKQWGNIPSFAQLKTMSEDVKSHIPEAAKALVSALQYAGSFSISLLSGGIAVVKAITFIVIVPVVAFYLLIDWDVLLQKIDSWLPRQHAKTLRCLAQESNDVLASFLRGQFLVCMVQSVYYAAVLQIWGLQYGFLLGLMAGVLTIVPYVGASLGYLMALLVALKQFGLDWEPLVIVSGVFALGQVLEGYVWVPRLVGSSVGLHPLWIMFSLMAFGSLFGFLGVLIAVPVMAVLGVVMRFLFSQYLRSKYYLGLNEDQKEEGGAQCPNN